MKQKKLECQNVPEVIFAGIDQVFTVYLKTSTGDLVYRQTAELTVSLLLQDGTHVAGQKAFLTHSGASISSKGVANVRLSIKESSVGYKQKFVVEFAVKNGQKTIASTKSSAFDVVRYKLQATLDGFDSLSERLWYKDVGGKDKVINLRVRILSGTRVVSLSNSSLPLKLVLCYHDKCGKGLPVKKQKILEVLSTSKSEKILIKSSGKALIGIRLNEVSSKHQNQSFCIRVEPDLSENPLFADVASTCTGKIMVRSKPSKPKKRSWSSRENDSQSSDKRRKVASKAKRLSLLTAEEREDALGDLLLWVQSAAAKLQQFQMVASGKISDAVPTPKISLETLLDTWSGRIRCVVDSYLSEPPATKSKSNRTNPISRRVSLYGSDKPSISRWPTLSGLPMIPPMPSSDPSYCRISSEELRDVFTFGSDNMLQSVHAAGAAPPVSSNGIPTINRQHSLGFGFSELSAEPPSLGPDSANAAALFKLGEIERTSSIPVIPRLRRSTRSRSS